VLVMLGRPQGRAHAHRDGFLADVGMDGAVDPLGRAQLDCEQIELADQDQLAKDLDQLGLRQ